MAGSVFLAHQKQEKCPKCKQEDIYTKIEWWNGKEFKMCGQCFHKWIKPMELKFR